MKKEIKGCYKSKGDDNQILFATGVTGIGPHTKKPSMEGYCYYVETGEFEYSKHWLQDAFIKNEVARNI